MRVRAGFVAIVSASWTLLLASPLSVSAQNTSEPHGSVSEQYLFAAANAERAQRGLPELRWDSSLYRAASGHAEEMASRQSISHQYPGEPELADRGRHAGARFSRIAENVAEAPTAVRIHDAWMKSPGHRENLLDPSVDSVAISVIRRNGQLYAVEDFDRSVMQLSLDEQESAIAALVASAGRLSLLPSSTDARRTCAMETGYAGPRQPWFVMRFTAADVSQIPDALREKIQSGKYHQAAVAACETAERQPFTSYSLAVMLYP